MQDTDCYGVDPIGANDDGVWFGTANAWMLLGDPDTSGFDPITGEPDGSQDGPDHPPKAPTYFNLTGFLGSDPLDAHCVASDEDRVLSFLRNIGATEVRVLEATRLSRRRYKATGFVFLTDEQVDRRLSRGRTLTKRS